MNEALRHARISGDEKHGLHPRAHKYFGVNWLSMSGLIGRHLEYP